MKNLKITHVNDLSEQERREWIAARAQYALAHPAPLTLLPQQYVQYSFRGQNA